MRDVSATLPMTVSPTIHGRMRRPASACAPAVAAASASAVPATSRVAVLEKIPHPYYIDRPFVLLSYLEQGMVDFRTVDTPDKILAELHRLGATHVAVDVKGLDADADPFEKQVTALWRATVARLGTPSLSAGGYALYDLPAEGKRA